MAKSTKNRRSVWVVDDDPIARLLINKTLERTGEFVSSKEYVDGSVFIHALEKMDRDELEQPDLILLDINMPEKDGWAVLEFIEHKQIAFKRSQLVLLTSSINPKDRDRAMSYHSVKGFLNKPLTQEDLQSLNL